MKYFFSWCNCPVNNQHLKVKKTSLWSKHIKGSKEHLFIRTTTQYANFRGNPLCQAPKFHLNDSETVKKMMKNEMRSEITYLLCWAMLFSCPVFGKMFHIYVWHWMCRHRKQGPHLWRTCMLHHGPAFFFFSLVKSKATCLCTQRSSDSRKQVLVLHGCWQNSHAKLSGFAVSWILNGLEPSSVQYVVTSGQFPLKKCVITEKAKAVCLNLWTISLK